MYNTFLLNDFYKITHLLQYSDKITHLTSYLTPRGSRLKHEGIDKVVLFGLSGYIKKYVVDDFNNNFFNKEFFIIQQEVTEVLKLGLGYSDDIIERTIEKLRALHELGYLPVEINAVPEGTLVPMGVPCVEIRSTDANFFWVGQSLEASLSAAIWHPMVSATVGREYRKIAEDAFKRTVDDNIDARIAMCDFSMRGQESNESAIASSAGWLTAMWNSSTVMARSYVQNIYNDKPEDLKIGGLTSTEHSVMTSHACLDNGDEEPTFKYLFDLYKDVSFAAVSDSYDFWNVLTNILPKFKDVIDERGKRGKFIGVRHDSADPVEALCGIPVHTYDEYTEKACWLSPEDYDHHCFIDNDGKEYIMYLDEKTDSYVIDERNRTWEEKGMVETMYELFGGSINSKGFKVLNPGIKAVYGDSITITRAKEIYRRLEAKGFAANNVNLGVGSFSFQALEGSDFGLSPYTRDTFSICVKCSHSKFYDNNGIERERFVYKDPRNFSGKKSTKGLCHVYYNENGELTYNDLMYEADITRLKDKSVFVNYFLDGKMNKFSFNDIRQKVTDNL